MRIDERCKKLNELSDHYHALLRQLSALQLERLCGEMRLEETLCTGDYMLLYAVGEDGDSSANMAAISKQLGINPSTATRRVNRLLADGMVTKSVAADDDRRYDLRLTDKGALLLDRMDEFLYDTVQKAYEPISSADLQAVYRFLETCCSQLEQQLD